MRVLVLAALAVTLSLAGPRAWTVLAHQVEAASAGGTVSRVAVDRVGFRQCPKWLAGDLLVEVMRDLSPRLSGQLAITDDAGARQLERALAASPFVAGVLLRRAFPDRFRVELELRRPVMEVRVDDASTPAVLVDAEGVCLPPVAELSLPVTRVRSSRPANQLVGRAHPDERVCASARVAAEWRDEIASRVSSAPELLEIDASNLHYDLLAHGDIEGPRPGNRLWSEIRVGLAARDGRTVFLSYGHPPGADLPRIEIGTKAEILRSILAEYPGFVGIDGGDLRFARRWRDWLRLQSSPTPIR